MYIDTLCACFGAHGSQKGVLDPSVLELQVFVGHCVNTRNQSLGPLQEQELLTMKPHFFFVVSMFCYFLLKINDSKYFPIIIQLFYSSFWFAAFSKSMKVLLFLYFMDYKDIT